MNDINYYGKTIYYIILYIILVIAIVFIIEEITRMSLFCYNYSYNYNYGKINENLCSNDNKTGIIEYERARYRVFSNLNKNKFENDLFNKNWINYATFLIITLLTLIITIAFGTIFYYYFIDNITNCDSEIENEANMSSLKLLIKCMFGELHRFIPNCTINYLLLFIIVIVYPIIILLKAFLNIDYTVYGSYWSKLFHVIISISLLLLVIGLLKEKIIGKDENNKDISVPVPLREKYLKILIYIAFFSLFYISQHIFKESYDEYNNQFKSSNIYDNELDKNDTMFFDIYKQQEPIKPQKPDILVNPPRDNDKNLLITFNYCSQNELTVVAPATIPPKCGTNLENYKNNLEKINKYYNEKKNYDKILKNYNNKYNIYKNNNIDFPEILTIFQGIIPKFLGLDKSIFIFIYILIAIFVLIYGLLNFFNYTKYSKFYYNTIIMYLIGLISILVLSNSILTFNTYFNKYHIYEPLANYKYDITRINILFDLAIVNKNTQQDYITKLYLYKEINDKTITSATPSPSSSSSLENIDDVIKKILKDGYTTATEIDSVIAGTSMTVTNLAAGSSATDIENLKITTKIINAIHIALFSSLLYLKDVDDYSTRYINENDKLKSSLASLPAPYKFNFYYIPSGSGSPFNLINSTSLFNSSTLLLTTDFYNFIQILKGTAVNNTNTIDNKLNLIKNAIKYLIYTNSTNDSNNKLLLNLTGVTTFYKNYLLSDIETLIIPEKSTDEKLGKNYEYNRGVINEIIKYYGLFLIQVRSIVIKLFNGSSIYCDTETNDINIYTKIDEYLLIITKNGKIKTIQEEPRIEIYKKMLTTTVGEFNKLYRNYFNVIKVLIYKKKITIENDTNTPDDIFEEIKNNYNLHFPNNKYNKNSFINDKELKLRCDEFISKYKKMKIKEKEAININIDNVSWSFIILVIIFAIILLEPIII